MLTSICKGTMNLSRICIKEPCMFSVPFKGLKYYVLPPSFDKVEYPERVKLKYLDKVPTYPPGLKAPKMQKRLILMRGPELVHNKLIHKQYGIIATQPGRLRFGHFEMIRLTVGRRIDTDRMFAIWRIDPPWQAVTRKGQGKRMGGGKGAIDHYVTPIKNGRVVIEIGGHCEFSEVYPVMEEVIGKLPFSAKAVSQEIMEEDIKEEAEKEKSNLNRYTFKYIVQNNMGNCHLWISPYDRIWFGKHR